MTPREGVPQAAGSPAPVVDLIERAVPRKALERDVERLSARVAELEREKAALEGFAAVAAHELVEPLVMTEAYASLVSDRLDPEGHADSLHDLRAIGRASARTRRLVETLLQEARASERRLQLRPVELREVVEECLVMLAPEIEARGATVELDDLPEVRGEATLLASVFVNLIVNALKYSPRRGPAVRIRAARGRDCWTLRVESSGRTIPAEDRKRIFDPFQRSKGERRARGAGLGLAICRRIIERHGGTIGVTSANGTGNSFFFTLPAE